jgi:hypothetical protein
MVSEYKTLTGTTSIRKIAQHESEGFILDDTVLDHVLDLQDGLPSPTTPEHDATCSPSSPLPHVRKILFFVWFT